MGQDRATAVLRPALGLLLVLNALALVLLIADLRPALAEIVSTRGWWRPGLLILGAGMLAPLGFVLLGGSPPVLLAAVVLLLFGSLAIRFEIIKIPQVLSRRSQQ